MLKIGTQLQGRYEIEKQIGQGGMGAVYLAVDHKFGAGNRVAIKETFYESPELAEAFEREARLLNSLHHPILPHVSDYFSEGGGSFLVMEYIEGEDMSAILKRDGVLPFPDVMRWTKELLDGLDYIHSQEPPVTHRDIKPNNLKLTSRGFIVLLDFGLAKETLDVTLGERSIFGYSRKYSPLEQIEGVGTDARSDIFSLGATIYHLLAGEAPADALARASAIVAGNPDPLVLASDVNAKIPESIAYVLHSALALNAEQRFASAPAMRAALEHALNPESFAVPEESENAASAGMGVVSGNTVEIVSFPALQAFKAEIEQTAPEMVQTDAAPIIEPRMEPEQVVDVSERQQPTLANETDGETYGAENNFLDAIPLPDAQISESRPAAVVIPSHHVASSKWRKSAVWLLLIFAGMLAILYAVSPTGSADEVNPREETVATVSETVPLRPEGGDSAAVEASSLDRTASAETEVKVSKSIPAKLPVAEDPKPEDVVVPVSPTRGHASPKVRSSSRNQPVAAEIPVQPARRTARAAEGQTPASSIEDVFTGTSLDGDQNAQRQQRSEVRRWEEEENQRRERRRVRRENRQNRWPF